jgi:DNA replication protein DnaC
VIQHKTCTDCGKGVDVEIPDELTGKFREMLIKLGTLCGECAEREEAAEREREQQEARRLAAVAARERLVRSGLPSQLRDRVWSDLDRTGCEQAIEVAQAWARGELPGLVLTGPIGVGKTTIAATAACEYLTRRPLRWTSVPVLFARLGAGHNDQQRKVALELLTGREALVLDDLDKARGTEYGAEQVFTVIDNRITEGAPLLVTMNATLDELAARFPEPAGDAIASRLAGYCDVLRVDGEDRRLMMKAA